MAMRPGAPSTTSPGRVIGRASSSSPVTRIWLAACAGGPGPPEPTLGVPDGGGAGAAAPACPACVAPPAVGFPAASGFGFGFARLVATEMVGRGLPVVGTSGAACSCGGGAGGLAADGGAGAVCGGGGCTPGS